MASLEAAPFSLSLGATIDVKIIAVNIYGDSAISQVGSGATLVYVPDKPINIANMPEVTNALRIGVKWDDGPSDNGRSIIDYTVAYDQSTGVWVNLVTGLT